MVTPASVSWCAWLMLGAPLLAAIGVLLIGMPRRGVSATLAVIGILTSFGCTLWLFLQTLHGSLILPLELSVEWIRLADFIVPFGVLIDRLSLLMTLVVTGVGSMIFFYSLGYMAEDHGYSRYFGMLSLFIFSMLTIVLATNWVQLFMGWELVGFCSYALIGHWYEKPAAADAGKKAFMVNRVADVGLLLGILALWSHSSPMAADRTLHYQLLQTRLPALVQSGWLSTHTLSIIALLIFCGVVGKSAQMPLHVWLPDAMEGPTSVSALIHAATMVAAGVYLLCRAFWLFADAHTALHVIAWVGGITAFATACLALVEADLKRVLAYSTLSQLGYMVMALGLGGPIPGMYHLTTHAFFKALLFLAAGSVIHGTHRQNIWQLGGLWKSMPVTTVMFFIGSLALAGVPFLSGFFSKDEILVLAYEHNTALYWLGTVTAGLTAFYITRAMVVAFFRPAADSHLHAHESSAIMLGPLAVLSALSICGGYLGIPLFLGAETGPLHWNVALTSGAVIVAGVGLACVIYAWQWISASRIAQRLGVVYTVLSHRYYFDDVYNWYVEKIQQQIFAGACAWLERNVIIEFAVNGTALVTHTTGRIIRRCQTGQVQSYALIFFGGLLVLLLLAGVVHP